MRFSATQLMPTESLWCSSSFLSSPPPPTTTYVIKNLIFGISKFTTTTPPPLPQHPPLILWGLTLGMIADFLGPLSSGVPNFWTWPTFSSWDYRLAAWLFTWAFRTRKLRELRTAEGWGDGGNNNNHRGEISTQLSDLDGVTFCASTTSEKQAEEKDEAGEEGEQQKRISVVGKMLDGYFDRAMLAAALVLFLRLGLTTAFLFASIKYRVHTRRLLTYYYGQVYRETDHQRYT